LFTNHDAGVEPAGRVVAARDTLVNDDSPRLKLTLSIPDEHQRLSGRRTGAREACSSSPSLLCLSGNSAHQTQSTRPRALRRCKATRPMLPERCGSEAGDDAGTLEIRTLDHPRVRASALQSSHCTQRARMTPKLLHPDTLFAPPIRNNFRQWSGGRLGRRRGGRLAVDSLRTVDARARKMSSIQAAVVPAAKPFRVS
jgi:hypothetical protein